MAEEDWNFTDGRFLSYVLAPIEAGGQPLFVVLNAAQQPVEFTLPEWSGVDRWEALVDTGENDDRVDGGKPGEMRHARPLTVSIFAGAS
jgi:glycogen operon protein